MIAQKIYSGFVLKFGIPNRIHHDQGKKFGIPNLILHDQGKQLENHLPDEILKVWNKEMKNDSISPAVQYSSRKIKFNVNTNSTNSFRKSEIKMKCTDSLNKSVYAYNCTRHSVTSFSLYCLLFGRNPQLPLDVIINAHKNWSERMTEAFKIASENTKNRKH